MSSLQRSFRPLRYGGKSTVTPSIPASRPSATLTRCYERLPFCWITTHSTTGSGQHHRIPAIEYNYGFGFQSVLVSYAAACPCLSIARVLLTCDVQLFRRNCMRGQGFFVAGDFKNELDLDEKFNISVIIYSWGRYRMYKEILCAINITNHRNNNPSNNSISRLITNDNKFVLKINFISDNLYNNLFIRLYWKPLYPAFVTHVTQNFCYLSYILSYRILYFPATSPSLQHYPALMVQINEAKSIGSTFTDITLLNSQASALLTNLSTSTLGQLRFSNFEVEVNSLYFHILISILLLDYKKHLNVNLLKIIHF